jgi:hypothetical protein
VRVVSAVGGLVGVLAHDVHLLRYKHTMYIYYATRDFQYILKRKAKGS